MIRDVTDLEVHQRALELLDQIYTLIKVIPMSHFKLRKQISEAAESIAPLIAEGFAKKRSVKEFKRFLEMALGSSDEVVSHLRVAQILAKHYPKIPVERCNQLIIEYKIISKKLQKLIDNWVMYPSSVISLPSSGQG